MKLLKRGEPRKRKSCIEDSLSNKKNYKTKTNRERERKPELTHLFKNKSFGVSLPNLTASQRRETETQRDRDAGTDTSLQK